MCQATARRCSRASAELPSRGVRRLHRTHGEHPGANAGSLTMAIRRDDFPLPDVDDPLTAPYFEGAARGELTVTRCVACGEYVWYPQEQCPHHGGALEWVTVSGRATLFSWAVVHRAFLPAFADM